MGLKTGLKTRYTEVFIDDCMDFHGIYL